MLHILNKYFIFISTLAFDTKERERSSQGGNAFVDFIESFRAEQSREQFIFACLMIRKRKLFPLAPEMR
jgi:hypothetical protein